MHSSIRKAVAASVFRVSGFSGCKPANANKENMTTDRTTEEDNPVKKAKLTKKKTRSKSNKGFNRRHRLHKGRSTNKSKAYRKPMCNPESASTWLAPETE